MIGSRIVPRLGIVFCLLAVGCNSGSISDERSPGEQAFRANCQSCHRLPNPSSKSDDEWPTLVARYGQRAKLTDEQIQLVVDYLVAAN